MVIFPGVLRLRVYEYVPSPLSSIGAFIGTLRALVEDATELHVMFGPLVQWLVIDMYTLSPPTPKLTPEESFAVTKML